MTLFNKAAQRWAVTALIVLLASSAGSGQVKTTVPDVVAGARPATVERITIHGTALEGNLEGDAVDRDRPRLSAARLRPRPEPSLPGRLRASRLLDRRRAVVAGDPRAADDRRRVRSRRERDDCRAAGLEDGAQRIDVLELGDDRRLRDLHRARRGRATSTRTTGRLRTATAAVSSATRWAAMARAASG